MKKLLGFCLVGCCVVSAWGAGAPLLLDWGVVDTASAEQQKRSQAIRTSARAATVQRLSAQGTAPWLVQFNDVIQEEWKTAMVAAGAKLKGYIPENAYLVEATPKQIATIGALDSVAYVGEFLPEYKRAAKVRAKLARVAAAVEADFAAPHRVLLFSGDDLAAVVQKIEALTGATVKAAQGDLIRADLTSAQIEAVTGWGEVQWIEPYTKPRLWNNVSVQTNKMNVSNVWTTLGLKGAGQTIAVCDTGLDTGNTGTLHRDFTNRVTGFGWTNGAYSSGYSWADYDEHGTHVCGSVLGNGTMSTGLYKGVAYEANLIIQGTGPDLSGIPYDLSELFRQAFTNGARIHSDSWGYDDHGYYNTDSRAVDMYVWSNKTMLILVAAGNSGTDSNTMDGVIDPMSVASPATAKNCMTVGASENTRTSGGYSTTAWGDAWPDDYGTVPVSTDLISRAGTGYEGMAAFSSRGPCNDGRIKPDIVAPGTDIISTRTKSVAATGWGTVSGNTNYIYMGGTSMATPLTAGAAGLTRQWVTTTGGITNPSGQLLKALMLNGARNMAPGQYGTSTKQEIPTVRPNNVEGWGHVDLFNTLQPATNQFLDLYDTNSLSTGQTNTFTLTVSATSTNKFILTMAYADYWGTAGSGKQLINDLDLTVVKPGGTTNFANGRTSKDATNNVEMIEFAADEAGTYTVRVVGRTVPSGTTQAYALVIRGPLADETPTAPVFGANPGPVSTTTGVAVAFTVTTTAGYPAPVLSLQSTTASTGYTFTAGTGQLNYTPPVADVGTQTFTFTATNASGSATQTVSVVVYEAAPAAPASIWASATNTADFTAAWSSVSGATGYRLDVATNSAFSGGGGGGGSLIDEDFTDFSDWTDGGTASDTTHAGGSSPCRALGIGDTLTSPAVDYPTQMTFYVDASAGGDGLTTTNYYSLDGGGSWLPIGAFTSTTAGATETQVLTSSPNLSGSTGVLFRFVSAYNTWYLDDVQVTGGSAGAPSYVAGYSNRTVGSTSQSVTGLTAGATYYFRARAVSGGGTSSNSATASVTTLASLSAPVFGANPGPAATTAGVAVAFTVSATGSPTPTLALQSTTASTGYVFTAGTGQLDYTPPQADGGAARTFTFTASNSQGVASQTVTVNVTAATAPAFTGGAGPYSTTTGVQVAFTVSASGTPAPGLALQSTTASSGYSFTPATGAFTYTPPEADAGARTFTFTASNVAGVVTQVTSVTVAAAETAPAAPAAIWASATNATDFTAAWSAVSNATSYRLDVGTNATFTGGGGAGGQSLLASNAATSPSLITNEWSGAGLAGTTYIQMLQASSSITSPAFSTEGFTNLTVDTRARTYGGVVASNNTITVSISTNNGSAWTAIGTMVPGGSSFATMPTLTNTADLGHAQTRIRWQTLGASGSVGAGVSNLVVQGWSSGGGAPAYVAGYSNRTVAGTSQSVTGLVESATYYFRARAVNGAGTSPNSATASVTTAASGPADQTIDFPAIGAQLTTSTVSLAATASSGLTVTFAVGSGPGTISGGTTLTFTNAGTVSIVASQAGNGSWNPAPDVTNSFSVTKAAAGVTLGDLSHIYDGTPKSATATTVPSGLAVGLTYAGSGSAPSAIGSYAVTGTVSDAIYQGSATGTLDIVSVTNVFETWLEDEQGQSTNDPNFAPDADMDGDGANTWDEFLADTDPNASNSCLVLTGRYTIASASNVTGAIRLQFPASTSRYYQLEYCTGLTNHEVGVTNLGWGVSGMIITNDSTGTWYGVIRSLLQDPNP